MATPQDDVKKSLTGPQRKSVHISEEKAEIIEISEKHGPLYNAIPCMPVPVAVIFCILNIFIPGLGTFFASWTALCGCDTRMGKPVKAWAFNLLAALLQMISFIVIVGWVWSIIWGMNFVQLALSAGEPQRTPYYVRRQSSVEAR